MNKLGGIFIVLMAGLGLGYYFGARHNDLIAYLAPGALPPLDYYCSQPSFSEVINTKANLDGLCRRFRTEVQVQQVADQKIHANDSPSHPGHGLHPEEAIATLERGLQEFAGTSQQIEVAQDLLLTLKKAKQYDRWMDIYLTALYEQPTHPAVANLAREALEIAALCGREKEAIAALNHLQAIPLDFSGKAEVQAALRYHKHSFAAAGPPSLAE